MFDERALVWVDECRLRVPAAGIGCGLLIAPDRILTSRQLIASWHEAQARKFCLEDERGWYEARFRPDDCLLMQHALDFTIIACDPVVR